MEDPWNVWRRQKENKERQRDRAQEKVPRGPDAMHSCKRDLYPAEKEQVLCRLSQEGHQ